MKRQIKIEKILHDLTLKQVLDHVVELIAKYGPDSKIKIVSKDQSWRIDLEVNHD